MTLFKSNIKQVRRQVRPELQYPIWVRVCYQLDNHIYQQLRFPLVNRVWDGFRHLIKIKLKLNNHVLDKVLNYSHTHLK